MKRFYDYMIAGNFYRYDAYKVTDYYGRTYFIAEPQGAGVTRIAETFEKLQQAIDNDVKSLNKIWTK